MRFPWTEYMQEEFGDFERAFKAPFVQTPVPEAVLQQYKGVLPDNLLAYWERYGWCGYRDGLFWTVNPAEYTDILEKLIPLTDLGKPEDNVVIARGGFGHLEIWNKERGGVLLYSPNVGILFQSNLEKKPPVSKVLLERDMAHFFSVKSGYRYDQEDEKDKALFERAVDLLGPLAENEMFGFVPAICLGGKFLLKNLQKVDITTHLEMLIDMSPPVLRRL